MSTSSTDQRLALAFALVAALLAGCASKPQTASTSASAVDNVNTVRAVRQQPAAPTVAASDSVHQATVAASPAAQQAAQLAVADYYAALQAMKSGKLDEAMASFRTLAAKYPVLSGPQVNQALIHVQREQWAEALKATDAALKINPRNPYAWNLRGIVLRQQGQFKGAREAYEKAIALDANYAMAHFNLGVLADLYLQDQKLALNHYEKYQALQKKPDTAVGNWISDLRNRLGLPPATAPAAPANTPAPATPETAAPVPTTTTAPAPAAAAAG